MDIGQGVSNIEIRVWCKIRDKVSNQVLSQLDDSNYQVWEQVWEQIWNEGLGANMERSKARWKRIYVRQDQWTSDEFENSVS